MTTNALATVIANLVAIGLLNCSAVAEGAEGFSEINLQGGNLLPDQIDGIPEIMPFGAIYYKFPLGSSAGIEVGGANAHAHASDFTMATIRARGDISIEPDLKAIAYIGEDWNYYTYTNDSVRQTAFGFHVGGGGMFNLLDTLWLRGEMRFSVGPGTGLYFGVGVSFIPGGGSAGGGGG